MQKLVAFKQHKFASSQAGESAAVTISRLAATEQLFDDDDVDGLDDF